MKKVEKKTYVLSPLLKLPAECPACKQKNSQLKLKNNFFVVRTRGLDFRPLSYTWIVKGAEPVNPHFFYLWTCPQCFYTASSGSFEEPFRYSSERLPKAQREHLLSVGEDSWREQLVNLCRASNVDYGLPERTCFGVSQQYLMAAGWLLTAGELAHLECHSIARYLLHLSWLWQDKEYGIITMSEEERGLLRRFLADLRLFWSDAPTTAKEAEALALEKYIEALEVSKVGDTVLQEIEHLLLLSRLCGVIEDKARMKFYLSQAVTRRRTLHNEQEISSRKHGIDADITSELRRQANLAKRLEDDARIDLEKAGLTF